MQPIGLYTPVRDGGAAFAAHLDAVRRLAPAPARWLVVDDGSSDGSGQRARAAGAEVVRLESAGGLARARNAAWGALDTPLVAALDADCCPAHDWLGRLSDALAQAPYDVAGVGGRVLETGSRPGDAWRARWLRQDWGPHGADVDFLFGANSLLRRDAVEQAGGYDERYRSNAEDWALGRALRAAGWRLRHVPEAHVRHLRRDRCAGALRNYWRHRFYGHRRPLSWSGCAASALTAVRSAASMAWQDLRGGRGELLLLDLALAPTVIWRDLEATWRGRM